MIHDIEAVFVLLNVTHNYLVALFIHVAIFNRYENGSQQTVDRSHRVEVVNKPFIWYNYSHSNITEQAT